MPDDPQRFMLYIGKSMNPTLKNMDMLRILPYDDRKIRCGDVIVFHPVHLNRLIAHRVFHSGSKGIRTKGDNNDEVDPWIVNQKKILGRVVNVQRGNRKIRIYRGFIGQLFLIVAKIIHRNESLISYSLHPIYDRLAQSNFFKRRVFSRIQIKIVSFFKSKGPELHLLMGHRVVGRRLPGHDKWQIQRPYRLLIDEISFPSKDLDHLLTPELEKGKEL